MKTSNKVLYNQYIARWGLYFMLPSIALLFLFQLFPIVYSLFISFHEYDILSPPKFIGLKNFLSLKNDPLFISSVNITITYVFYTIVPVIGLSFFIAWSLTKIRNGRGVWRSLIFIPTILPLVSVALVWQLLFNFRGPINEGLAFFELEPISWLANSNYAPWSMIIMSWWHATSYYTIIFLAGFLSIPRSYYEAARVEGASGFEVLRYITLPLMKPTITLVIVLSSINGLKTFAFQQIITDGGPADSTLILTLLIFKTSFSYLKMGLASTYSIILFSGILIISLIQIWLLKDNNA